MTVGTRGKANWLNGTATVALAMMALAAVEPAHAGCSDNDPADGETVICDSDTPNPDEDGVGSVSRPSDVTLQVGSGATIGNGNLAGRATIMLGGGASITSDAGSTIRGGIDILGDGGVFDLGGDVDTILANGSNQMWTLRSTATMQGGPGPQVFSVTGDDNIL